MIRTVLLLALALSSAARADTSVALGSAAPPARCTYEDGPFWRAAHALADAKPNTTQLSAELRDVSAQRLLLSGFNPRATWRGAIVLERGSYALVRSFAASASALVEDHDGALFGVLTFEGGQLALVDGRSGKLRWRVPAPGGVRDESLHTLVAGQRLIVANYQRYATGSRLVALDLDSGRLLWTADVEQMNVAHSEYFNDVGLEQRGATVIMRGFEAAGCYVQSFDLASGRRLSSAMKRNW